MPRCCAQINDSQTNTIQVVYVEFDTPDTVNGLALAKEAANAAYRLLHAQDPNRYPPNPHVESFTKP